MITRIGKYDIQEELGRGGFGRVYRGYDPGVRRPVAIKILSSDGDPDMLARFRIEAGTTGKLSHPNIVTVFDFGVEDETPYLVMELLEGENLHQIIEKQLPLSILQKVQIMSQVAEALRYAHQKGVVHRDVKPANIMLLPDGTVKIMDFGIALMTGQGTRRTRQGDLIGSLLYMAPEQFRNIGADSLTDIFSYGVTFYELLTARNPFHAGDAGAAMYQITSVEPVRIREMVANCPLPLDNVVFLALTKDRDLRYQSLNDVVLDLQPILQELRQERASKILEGAQPLIAAEKWDEADALIRLALDLDPTHREARQLYEKIQSEIQQQKIRKRKEKFVQEADQQVAQQQFGEGIRLYESALRLDPSDEGILSRLEEAKKRLEARRRAGPLLTEAHAMARGGDLDGALNNVREALKAVPENREAKAFEKDLLRQIEERERVRKEQGILAQAQARHSQGDYEGALNLLSADDSKDLNSSAIAEYRTRLKAEWAAEIQRRRNQEFEAQLHSAEKLLDQQDLAAAEKVLQDSRNRFPEQSGGSVRYAEFRDRLDGRRKAQRIEAIRQNVVHLCEARQFSAARDALGAGLAAFRKEPALESLLENISAAESEHTRSLRIADVTGKVHQLQKDGDLKRAIEILQSPETAALEDTALKQWGQQLELDLARQERAASLRKAIEEGWQLLDLGQSDKALAALKEQSNLYGGEPEFRVLLGEAQRRVDLAEERRVVAQTTSRTAELESSRRWRIALDEAGQAARRYPQNPTLELLVTHLKKAVREQERLETVGALRQQIEEMLQAKNWTAAELALKSAHERFPNEPEFDVLAERLSRAKNMSELEALTRQVDLDLAADDIRTASARLDAVRGRFAQETMWQVSHREVERRQRYLDALNDAKGRHGSNDFAGAEQVLKGVIPIAQDLRAASLLEAVIAAREESEKQEAARQRQEASVRQKSEEVKRITESATEFNRKQSYDDAIRVLADGLRKYPDELPLTLLLRSTRGDKQAFERERALQKGLERCESLRGSQKWEEALEHIARLLSDHPNNPSLVELETKVRQEKNRAERAAAVRAAFRQAEEQLRAGRPSPAVSMIESAILTLGVEPELTALLERAKEAQRAEREKQYIESELKRAYGLAESGDVTGSLKIIDDVLTRSPNSPELLAARQRLNDDRERERRTSAEVAAIQEALNRKEWRKAQDKLDAGQKSFPSESVFLRLDEELRRRKREDLSRKVAEGRRLLNSGQVQEAKDFVSANLLGDSDDPEVTSLGRDIVAEKQRLEREEQKKAFIAEGLRAAQTCEKKGDHAGALSVLEKCLRQYPEDSELIDAQKRAGEQLRAADRRQLFEGIRRALQGSDWLHALELIDRARREHPNDPALVPFQAAALDLRRTFLETSAAAIRAKIGENKLDDARTLFDQNLVAHQDQSIVRAVAEELAAARAKREFVSENLNQAAQCEQQGDFSRAVTILQKALKKYPADPDLSAALSRVQNAIQRAEEERTLATKTSAIQRLLDRGNWAEALKRSEEIRSTLTENPAEFARLERQARELRDREIRGLVDKANACVKLGNLAEAEKLLNKKLAPFAAEPAVVALTTAINEEKVRQNLVQSARSHTAARRFEEAEAAINDLAARNPSDAEVGRLRSALESARDQERKEKLYRTGRAEGDQLLRNRQYTEAIARFEYLLTQFPGDRLLQQDLAGAIDVEQRHQKAGLQAETSSLTDSSGAAVTKPQTRTGFRKLQGWLYGIAGIVLAGVVALAIWLWPTRIEIRPMELSFKFQPGTPLEAAKVTVTGLLNPAPPKMPVNWVTVTPGDSRGRQTEFWVQVSPDKSGPGKHYTDLIFPSQKIVHVTLEVPAPPAVIGLDTSFLTFIPDQHGVTQPQKFVATNSALSKIPNPTITAAWVAFTRHDLDPGKTEFLVEVSPKGLADGSSADLIFSPDSKVHVVFAASKPEIKVTPEFLKFPDPQRGMLAQPVVVTSSSNVSNPMSIHGLVRYTRQELSPGKTQFLVSPALEGLPPGPKFDELVFSADKKVRIDLTVQGIEIHPESLSFPGPGGSMQSQIVVTGPSRIPELQKSVAWVEISRKDPSPGRAEFTVSVFPDRAGPNSPVKTELTLLPDKKVPVTLTLSKRDLQFTPPELHFLWRWETYVPESKSFAVTGSPDIAQPTGIPQWIKVAPTSSTATRTEFSVQLLPKMLDGDIFKDTYPAELDFQQKRYRVLVTMEIPPERGATSGNAQWDGGTLNAHDELVSRGRSVKNGNGAWHRLPMLNMQITKAPQGIKVLEEPSQGNNFTLRLKNESGGPVYSIEITWQKK